MSGNKKKHSAKKSEPAAPVSTLRRSRIGNSHPRFAGCPPVSGQLQDRLRGRFLPARLAKKGG